ncbi:MAG TPA: PAS domain-containing protein [Aliidongia sp.]|uniref:PAS domain-containing protein n=1 Tax=Aliidongia sp. TaxID=1914230 RepID=UPI002DDCF219|nr:PAS domain-containing protein [Aliidongia sp.]HEV2674686.1 PAS domain-containing protein [Aliidongia sp.]
MRTTELRRLLQHWHDLKGDRPLPQRADLDPTDIAYCLGNIALVEIEPSFRPRYRLVGTRLADLLGEDPTGRYVDEMYSGAIRNEALGAYRRTIETGQPDYCERVFNLLLLKLGYYRLLLPFAWRSGGQADLVVAAFFPTDRGFRRALDWLGRVPRQDA